LLEYGINTGKNKQPAVTVVLSLLCKGGTFKKIQFATSKKTRVQCAV